MSKDYDIYLFYKWEFECSAITSYALYITRAQMEKLLWGIS